MTWGTALEGGPDPRNPCDVMSLMRTPSSKPPSAEVWLRASSLTLSDMSDRSDTPYICHNREDTDTRTIIKTLKHSNVHKLINKID